MKLRQSHFLLSNAVIIWGSRVLLLIPQVILVPYLIKNIGEEDFGLYALVWSLLVGIDQLQRSLQLGVVKYAAEWEARGNIRRVNQVVGSSMILSFLMGTLALIFMFFWIQESHDWTGKLGASLAAVGAVAFLMMPLTPFTALIQSRGHYYVGAAAETVSKYMSLALVMVWFSLNQPSLRALILIMAGMLLFSRASQVPIAYRLIPHLRVHLKDATREDFGLIVGFGAFSVLLGVCVTANSAGLKWLMAALASSTFVAHLTIMLMPGVLLNQVISAMVVPLMPIASASHASRNNRLLQKMMLKGTRYASVLGAASILMGSILFREVLVLWVGPDYLRLAPFALTMFFASAVEASASPANQLLKGLGELRPLLRISFLGKVAVPGSVVLSVFLATGNPYLSVTLGVVLGNICYGILTIRKAQDTLEMESAAFVKQAVLQPVAAAALVGGPALFLLLTGGFEGVPVRMVLAFSVAVAFGWTMLSHFATESERTEVQELVKAVLRKVTVRSTEVFQRDSGIWR